MNAEFYKDLIDDYVYYWSLKKKLIADIKMENADLIIANCFANGRAVDDNVAVVFDVTKLEEYVLPVTQVTIPQQQ